MNTWFGRTGTELSKWGRELITQPKAYRALTLLTRAACGFLLARSVIFGEYAPFGVAWTAASGSGVGGLCALFGSMLGYFTVGGQVESLRYMAVLVLVYAAAFLFRGTSFSSHPFFLPGAAGALSALVGIVFVAGRGFLPGEVLLFGTEVLLTVMAGYFYITALRPDENGEGVRRAIGILVLASTLFLSLADIIWLGVLRPARVAAGIFVLQAAFRSGAGLGSAAGLASGIAMDMAIGYPFFSMSYGLSGLLAGVFKRAGKLATALVYVVTGAITALWAGTETLRLAALLETFAASVIFMLVPGATGARALESVAMEQTDSRRETGGRRAQLYAQKRLQQCALAFRDLHDTLSTVFEKTKNDSDIAKVFDRASDMVCRKCALRGLCWDREVTGTYQALADASGALSRTGKVTASDFPIHFSSRCVHFPKFMAVANDEMTALLLRRQYQSRLRESRRQLCVQYSEMSRIMTGMAEDVGREVNFDESAERRIGQFLASRRLSLDVTAARTGDGRRLIEIAGHGASRLLDDGREELLKGISLCVGYPVSMPEQICAPGVEKLIFSQAEPLLGIIGVACHKKQGQAVSGDSGNWFKTSDGKVYLMLSDGMGTGAEAGSQSAEAVRVLEKFLRAGIEPATALSTLNSALVLRGGEGTERFVTVDLCVCDMMSGQTKFFKNGAAPSYIKRGKRVSRVSGQGWPIGLGASASPGPEISTMKLDAGDMAVMMSDGVCEMGDEPWLTRLLEAYDGTSPKELAGRVLEQAVLQNGRSDDMTVQVLALESPGGGR